MFDGKLVVVQELVTPKALHMQKQRFNPGASDSSCLFVFSTALGVGSKDRPNSANLLVSLKGHGGRLASSCKAREAKRAAQELKVLTDLSLWCENHEHTELVAFARGFRSCKARFVT